MKKYDYVRSFYEDHRGGGVVRAGELYKLYSGIVPAKKRVDQGTFVRWAPEWAEHHKERRRIAAGEWYTESIVNLGD